MVDDISFKDKSKLFTSAELNRLNQFLKGNRKDKDGLFSARVKPKVKELLDWIPEQNRLERVLKHGNKRRI